MRLLHPESRGFYEALVMEECIQRHLRPLHLHHPETHDHSLRVGLRAIDLGYANGLEGRVLRTLGYAALMHDRGKTGVPRYILAREGEVTEEEMEIMRGHVRLGFMLLSDFPNPKVRVGMVGHHEHTNHPYPRNGKERRQTIRNKSDRRNPDEEARRIGEIIAIADMFDALHSKRCYREPLSPDEIAKILAKQFKGDPQYIDQVLQWCERN